MKYTINQCERPPRYAVATACGWQLADIEKQVNRLQAWALDRGAPITGDPFAVLRGDGRAAVHLPTDGRLAPDPVLGFTLRSAVGGQAIALRPVGLGDMPEVVREVGGELRTSWRLTGPVEYHPGEGGFAEGALLWPIVAK